MFQVGDKVRLLEEQTSTDPDTYKACRVPARAIGIVTDSKDTGYWSQVEVDFGRWKEWILDPSYLELA